MERTRMRTKYAAGVAGLVMTGISGCGALPEPVPDTPRAGQVSASADSSEAPSPLLPVAGAAAALFVGVGGVLVVLWRDRRTATPAPPPSTRPGRGEL
ncbi:hypothetical protein ACFVUH_36790 [Kitasatospora sp. NPDC058032]|uniref:hypothetical protein n=1 Tax=unclassified Kitasatospora TaxID=2633591 RepID=UPI0033B1A5DF